MKFLQPHARHFVLVFGVISSIVTKDLSAQSTIGTGLVYGFGGSGGTGSALYPIQGQSFTVPSAFPILTSFSFLSGGVIDFQYKPTFQLFAWTGSVPIGAPIVNTVLNAYTTYNLGGVLTFSSNVPLIAGGSYVALLDLTGSLPSYSLAGFDSSDPHNYSGGNAVVWNKSAGWLSGQGVDMYFTANFATGSTVPEPTSLEMVILALSALGAIRKIQSRRRELPISIVT
ncbi:MAG: PEP-CTERM sorting domain-containing protein [Gemmatimonadaceae bacterium]